MSIDYLEVPTSGMPAAAVVSSPGYQAPAPTALATTPDPGQLVQEKVPAASDSNTATRQTVQKMCEYIQAGVNDEAVQAWAKYALDAYPAFGQPNPCWSDFWLLKHSVKFARDEPRLFSIGEPDALDLLIAPAVLVRMSEPKEDCDGFTMLMCALLTIQKVKCYIVTVAADPSEPDRWSHVFCLAESNDGQHRIALDASHGKFPGWMVPRRHMFKWQAWDMSGNPVSVPPPEQNTLHGYVARGRRMRRGVGDGDTVDPGMTPPDTTSIPIQFFGQTPPFLDTSTSGGGAVTPTSQSSPFNWGSFWNNLFGAGTKAFAISQLPQNYFIDPATGRTIYQPTNVPAGTGYGLNLTGGSLGSLIPVLGIGLLAFVVISSMGRR